VVAHNGIIENYLSLKRKLVEEGHKFTTETDTEVIAHLIEKYFKGNLEEAVMQTLGELKGLFAFTCVSADDPQKIVAVREGAPIIVGSVEGEGFVASDVPAVLPYTRSILFLDDHEVAVVAQDGIRLFDAGGKPRQPQFHHITWDPIMAEKGGYKHFMLKEIYEQPTAIGNTVLGRYLFPRHEHRAPRRRRVFTRAVEELQAYPDSRVRNELAFSPRRQIHDRIAGPAAR
jgi:glucosamine--fructose-6-phosphate aminotransferase (isomerizing)